MKIAIHHILLFLSLLSCAMYVQASFFVTCVGVAMIQSIDAQNENQLSAAIKLHEHTFNCQGHGDTLDSGGVLRTVILKIGEGVSLKLLQVGTMIDVSYSYGDGLTPDGVISWKDWTVTGVNNPMNTPH